MLEGTFFGEPAYTDQEKEQINADINALYAKVMAVNPPHVKEAVITAGAPGSGKTTLINKLKGNYAYICPDDVALPALTGYQADKSDLTQAYTKWRAASNAANHLILGNLIKNGTAFCFGTTCASDKTHLFFKHLKDQRYRIKVIHVIAPDDVRVASIKERDKLVVQTKDEDIRQKGKDVPKRINDTFLAHADEIAFYYRGCVDEQAVHTATWTKDRKLTIIDQTKYGQMKAIHNAAVTAADLQWEDAVEKNSETIIFPAAL